MPPPRLRDPAPSPLRRHARAYTYRGPLGFAFRTSPLRKTNPLVLTKPDPGDAHSRVNSFPVAVERIVGGGLWTLWARGPRVWASRGQQGGCPRLAHTSRRARAGPQDSSTSPQARHWQAPWPTTCGTELMANGAGVQLRVSGIAKHGERTRAGRFGGNMLLAGRRGRRVRPVHEGRHGGRRKHHQSRLDIYPVTDYPRRKNAFTLLRRPTLRAQCWLLVVGPSIRPWRAPTLLGR